MTNNSQSRLLIIDDEAQIRKLLSVALHAHHFETLEASNGEEGILMASTDHPDLIVLDLGLPDGSGINVLKLIREWSEVPIIILTVKEREEDKILALESGADDYVTKPFGMGELIARIRVALRHTAKAEEKSVLDFGRLLIDLSRRVVLVNGNPIKFTPTEYELLRLLATHAGRVMTHRQLLKQVWGGQMINTDSNYLRVYIGHIRKKIEVTPTQPKMILTEPGVGYRFVE
ncbi:response regulator [Sporolactobacillus shoreicorticis]|uniref:Response regulator n=1 Tax=Sporolactobacillus shoreicorticis TaxID=1923877 RepID=A0ABW5S1H1_9BACL|nr:response regulator [Sporolactobacillus shoreicorticis]MCO7125314.1 response regulator [Sporolactobacillus shoreicorticis]